MPKKPAAERSTYRIKNGETEISFAVDGSVVLGMVEAFTWLTPDRRENLLKRLQVKQEELLAKESTRAAEAKAPEFHAV